MTFLARLIRHFPYAGKSRNRHGAACNSARPLTSSLSLEHLEPRIALSVDPVLTVVSDQVVEEGSLLSLTDLGTFTDEVEGSGGSSIGLDPTDPAFTALGAFDPLSDVMIDTDTLTISGGFSGSGTTVLKDVGFGSFEIAVFTFTDFDLDAGITLTATGSRPLALLSQSDLTVDGTIDVSAQFEPIFGREIIAGPGGGDGGDDLGSGMFGLDGYPAAGAPALGVGQVIAPAAGGSGGGFGGAGGRGSVTGSPSGVGGIAYADLATAIQGGSGGSAATLGANGGSFLVTGGGGGGGIELGAVQTVTIGTTGAVLANGGAGYSTASFLSPGGGGGGGAGGGILVHGTNVTQNGLLQAEGGDGGNGIQRGGGGGGGEILIVHSPAGTFVHGGTESVLGGVPLGSVIAEDGQDGGVTILAGSPSSTPVFETYGFVIDWGDTPPAVDSGAPTIDVPGVDVGDIVEGSFDGSHTYTDDGVYTVTVTIDDSGGGTDSGMFMVTVNNVDPTADDAVFNVVENSAVGTFVGTVTASDPGDDTLTFNIVGGTGASAFSIDSGSGEITVANSTLLDYETTPTLTLNVDVSDGDGGSDTALISIDLLNQASISGNVYVDVDEDGLFDADELGIDGVLVELLDELGNPVLDSLGDAITATTSDGGFYLFEDLDPGIYQLLETQPTGVDDGQEQLGSLGGTIVGDDLMQLTLARTDAFDYVFAEIGQQVGTGSAAAVGFWQNKNGQELIAQGGTQLADWLTVNFSNIFGNSLVGADGSDVADFYREQLFIQKGKKTPGAAKVDAQFMGAALATYFTSRNLAGDVGADYGFTVTDTGIGTSVVNIESNGDAFNVADGTNLTIMQLLLATDSLTDQPDSELGFAAIYDTNGDGIIDDAEAALRVMANDVYRAINVGSNV